MKIVFATNNVHKLHEINNFFDESVEILNLNDINCYDEIPETGATLEENASQKSKYIYDRYQVNCFADDTGLEIEALNGEPGVYSARYAGEDKDAEKNMEKVLLAMADEKNRKARFRTVISLLIDGEEILFEGVVRGHILHEVRGAKGFGYDPIFQPVGYDHSFAEMDLTIKNKISHRGLAVEKLVAFLKARIDA